MAARPNKPLKLTERAKQRKAIRVQQPSTPSSVSSSLHRTAVSTGQAALYCFVSAGAVLHWIADGQLPAQRTPGGQYRILLADLRAFMVQHGMRTDSLDGDLRHLPFCWESWMQAGKRTAGAPCRDECAACPVYRSGALLCHEIRPFLPSGTLRAKHCADCEYTALRALLARPEAES